MNPVGNLTLFYQGYLMERKSILKLKDSHAAVGSWIVVCYSSTLRYVGRVVSRTNTSISANFLDQRDGGLYQIRKGVATVLKDMVFMNNVDVLPVWSGPGRYRLHDERGIARKRTEHWLHLRMQEQVQYVY